MFLVVFENAFQVFFSYYGFLKWIWSLFWGFKCEVVFKFFSFLRVFVLNRDFWVV